MLGLVSLIALFVLGLMHLSPWLIAPFAILNGWIGLHFPAGKAQMMQRMGTFWTVFWTSLPLQALFAWIVFGAGYLVGMLFN